MQAGCQLSSVRLTKSKFYKNNYIVLTQKWGLTNSHLRRTPGIEDRSQRNIGGLLMRGATV